MKTGTIEVNGEKKAISGEMALNELLCHLELVPEHIAVELNRQVIPRDRYAKTNVCAGDRLEIVTFVGGG